RKTRLPGKKRHRQRLNSERGDNTRATLSASVAQRQIDQRFPKGSVLFEGNGHKGALYVNST
ncbi:hypothetical protein LZG37_25020, partial [Halomonas titanicae]|uniref:hypothetical protein n=1 Tax=Vreelandella titanicae TaxID=664683 RepID=UPI001F3656A4